MTWARRIVCICLLVLGSLTTTHGQIDPTKRELLQVGYNQPLQGHGPLSGYGFYYLNLPEFLRTNLTLRLALAPVYLDSEVGFSGLLGPHTDLGLGVAGGGFADSYVEVRRGDYIQEESFTGHGGGLSASIYHLFNPGRLIPLYGVLRNEFHYSVYDRDDDTDDAFELPEDRANYNIRTGLRFGGREPRMIQDLAMELSIWYEAQWRTGNTAYGFDEDRRVEDLTHLYWARGLFAYTVPKWKHNFNVSLTLGGSANADRFSVYRLGGLLPMVAEFPLSLPGYYFQEISARRFVLFGGNYVVPLDADKRWSINFLAATAGVDYLSGLQQPGRWHSGVGSGFGYRSPKDTWQIMVGYAYGIDAIRNDNRGAHSIGFLLQFDLEQARLPLFEPGENPIRSRGLQRFLRLGNF